MNRRVIIERATETTDAEGGIAQTWATVATVWATIQPLRGDERTSADVVAAETTHKMFMRYSSSLSALTPKDRIKYGSRVFDIQAALNAGEKNRMLELRVKERL